MEKSLKVLAVILTLIIVLCFYPAVVWNLFSRPGFWMLYFFCIAADFLCIRTLKKLQK